MEESPVLSSVRSLRKRWWVCFAALAVVLVVEVAEKDNLSNIEGIVVWMGLIVGFGFSILCFAQQWKVTKELNNTPVRPGYWRALLLASWAFGPPGVLIEVGIYLVYVRRYLRQHFPAQTVAP